MFKNVKMIFRNQRNIRTICISKVILFQEVCSTVKVIDVVYVLSKLVAVARKIDFLKRPSFDDFDLYSFGIRIYRAYKIH